MTTERSLRVREAIHFTLNAGDVLPTTEIARRIQDVEIRYHLVYQNLCALEYSGEIRRAGRIGTSASGEVLWQVDTQDDQHNQEFAELLTTKGDG